MVGWRKCAKFRFYLAAFTAPALDLQHAGASAPSQHAPLVQHASVPQHSPVAQQAAPGEQQAPLPQQALLALALTVMAPWQQDESASTSMPSASWGQGATAPEQPPPWQEPDS